MTEVKMAEISLVELEIGNLQALKVVLEKQAEITEEFFGKIANFLERNGVDVVYAVLQHYEQENRPNWYNWVNLQSKSEYSRYMAFGMLKAAVDYRLQFLREKLRKLQTDETSDSSNPANWDGEAGKSSGC